MLLLVSSMVIFLASVCNGFSDGRLFVDGNPAIKRMYCHRPALARPPIHLDAECSGLCQPVEGADRHFAVEVNGTDSTYWIDGINVIIRARENSGYSVTGFAIYAISDKGHVVGRFDENDDVIVASCDDVLHNTIEGSFAVHRFAKYGRQGVKVRWSPDGYNHKKVKFHVWVVHNHSHIFNLESEELTSEKNGNDALDINAIFQSLMGSVQASMSQFENTFADRQTQGYNIELDDPFSPFREEPSRNDLVPGFDQIGKHNVDNLIDSSRVRGGKIILNRKPRLSDRDDMGGMNSWGGGGNNLDSLILSVLLDKNAFESGLFHLETGMIGNALSKGGEGETGLGGTSLDNDMDVVDSEITDSRAGQSQGIDLDGGANVNNPEVKKVNDKETNEIREKKKVDSGKEKQDSGHSAEQGQNFDDGKSISKTGGANILTKGSLDVVGGGVTSGNDEKDVTTNINSSKVSLESQETTTASLILQGENSSTSSPKAITTLDSKNNVANVDELTLNSPEEKSTAQNNEATNPSLTSNQSHAPLKESLNDSGITLDDKNPDYTGSSVSSNDNTSDNAKISDSNRSIPEDVKGTKDNTQDATQDLALLDFTQTNKITSETKRFKRQSESESKSPNGSKRSRPSFVSSPPSWAMGPQMAVPGPPGNMPNGGPSPNSPGATSSQGPNGMRMPPQGMMGMPQSGMGMSPQSRMGMMQSGMSQGGMGMSQQGGMGMSPQSRMGMMQSGMSQGGMGMSPGGMGGSTQRGMGTPPQGSFNNGMMPSASNPFMQSGGSNSMMRNSFNPMMQQGNPMQQNQQFGGRMMGQQQQLGSPSNFPMQNGQANSMQNGQANPGQQTTAASQKPASKPFLIPGQSPPPSSSGSNPFGSSSGQPFGRPSSFPLGGPSTSGSPPGSSGQNPFSPGGQNPFASPGQGQNGNPFASPMPGQSQFPGQFGQAPRGPPGFPGNSQMSFGQQPGRTMPGSNPMFNQQQNQFGSGFNQQSMGQGQFGMSGGQMGNNGMSSRFGSPGFNTGQSSMGFPSSMNSMNNPWSSSNSFMGGNSGSRFGFPGNTGGMTNPFSSMMTRPSSSFSSNPFSSMGGMGSMSSFRNSMMGSMGSSSSSSRGFPGMGGGMSSMMNRGGMSSMGGGGMPSMMGGMPSMMGRGMMGMGSMRGGMPSMSFPTVSISRNSRRG